jgi:hypothetical protein
MPTVLPSRFAAIGVGAAVLLLSSVSVAAAAPAQTAAKLPSAATALKRLETQTRALPRAAVAAPRRARLIGLVLHARRVARNAPCSSVADLNSYRRTLRTTKVRPAAGDARRRAALRGRLAGLRASSMTASRSLLTNSRTKACGGGVKPSTLPATKTTILRSNESGMRLRIELPELRFASEEAAGQTWTRLSLPNTDTPAAPGSPGIPVASSVLGVPDGASLSVKASETASYTIDGVEVYPAQPQPVDEVTPPPDFFAPPFAALPFAFDRAAYAQRGFAPAQAAGGRIIGQARDITIGTLQVPAAQYDPVADRLKVLKSVVVDISFVGGSKSFSDELTSPWETAQSRMAGALLNAAVVKKSRGTIVVGPCGEELLVITNPTTRTAADTYANARRLAGFRTSVRETGAGLGQIGTTAAEVQTFIRSRLNALRCIHPSYVTIIGDDELVPTFTATPGSIPSDNPYSTKNDADELPDVAVGRILGNDLAQLDAAIAKIITYETTPPGGPMLNRATLAAQFQDDDLNGQENRTFIQFAETVRTGLVGNGVSVDRIYDDSPDATPLKFNDGTDLPAALMKPTFAWDGTGAEVTSAWNTGRFMIIHRDHGWSDGWGHPHYTTADVDALTNGANLPVVLSINCSSAAYDYDEDSFAQNALVKTSGGAVGVFGDTRDSPSWHNTQIALGFVDAMLPFVLPAEGPGTKQRVGDALVLGKLRLAGLAPPSGPGIMGGDGSTRNELYLWHYFGDPTMQMWGGGNGPIVFDPNIFVAVYHRFPPPEPGDPPPFLVEISFPPSLAGQAFSLLRNGEVIGKAIAGADGKVEVPATFNDGEPKPGELTVALEADGSPPVQIPVQGLNAAPTTLTQNCPSANQQVPFGNSATVAMTGNLSGAPAGSTVAVSFKHPDRPGTAPGSGPVETVQATTDASGNWSAQVTTTNRQDIGTWQVSSAYAGTEQYAPSSAAACPVIVFDNS